MSADTPDDPGFDSSRPEHERRKQDRRGPDRRKSVRTDFALDRRKSERRTDLDRRIDPQQDN